MIPDQIGQKDLMGDLRLSGLLIANREFHREGDSHPTIGTNSMEVRILGNIRFSRGFGGPRKGLFTLLIFGVEVDNEVFLILY